jgi:hypothetical protein
MLVSVAVLRLVKEWEIPAITKCLAVRKECDVLISAAGYGSA